SLLTKFKLSKSTSAISSSGISGCSTAERPTEMLSSNTNRAPATAVPTADARFCVVPRNEPTSPANFAGDDVTRTLNTSVTSAPCPTPKTNRPKMVGNVSQLLVTTKDSQNSAIVVNPNENNAIVRGGYFL